MVGPGEAIVAITAIVLGVGLTGLIIVKIVGLLKYWIDSRSGNKSSAFTERLEELERFSQRAEKRIQNLETIIVDNDMNLPSTETENHIVLNQEKRPLQNKLRE